MSYQCDPLNDLNELAQLQPDALATKRAVERAQAALSALPTVSAVQKSATRNWNSQLWRNLLIASAAVVLLALVTQWFLTRSDSNFAFAQVQEQVAKTKSVQFNQSDKEFAKDKIVFEGTGGTMILAADLSRDENHVQKQPEEEEPLRKKNNIVIVDYKTKKLLYLYPDEKAYHLVILNDLVGGVDLYRKFREIPAERTEKLPEKMLDGKKVIGFVLKETVDNLDLFDRKTTWAESTTYWVDATTKLPVRIEYAKRNKDPNVNERGETVRTDFVFDAPLDESLFSTDPPQGWKDVSQLFEVPIK